MRTFTLADYAHIESVDALKKFRVALIKFAEGISVALDEAEAEIQRTDMWLKQEQPAYWKHQVAVRTELCARAKSALKRKQLQTTGMNNRPSCVDELKELARAERALEEARQKQAEVRRWTRLFEQEGFSYTATAQRLRTASQTGLPRALAQLDAMIEAIEAYGASPAWQWQGSTSGSSPDGANVPEDAQLMGRATPPAIPAYAQLRALTPNAAVRTEVLLSQAKIVPDSAEAAPPSAMAPVAGQTVDRETLLELAEPPHKPPMPDDKVILADGAFDRPRIYMERTLARPPGDSGWHVGVVGRVVDNKPARYVAIRVHDLLAKRPSLAEILRFPPGWLIVMNNGALEAVLDATDALRWYGGETRAGSATHARAGAAECNVPTGVDGPREARAE
jgi:hypothetical protein